MSMSMRIVVLQRSTRAAWRTHRAWIRQKENKVNVVVKKFDSNVDKRDLAYSSVMCIHINTWILYVLVWGRRIRTRVGCPATVKQFNVVLLNAITNKVDNTKKTESIANIVGELNTSDVIRQTNHDEDMLYTQFKTTQMNSTYKNNTKHCE